MNIRLCDGFSVAHAWLLCLTLALLGGCSTKSDNRPRRVPVSGVVMYKGQPVEEATVLFEPTGGTPAATGTTDSAGRYRLTTFEAGDGAVPGEYKVAIRKVKVIRGKSAEPVPDDYVGPPPDEKWLLPTKYGYSESSGLTASVKEGAENQFKFELAD
jgi:hypothetical protein